MPSLLCSVLVGEKSIKIKKRLLFASLILLFGVSLDAQAQQTIFNVPSADVLDKGKAYGELDVSFKLNKDRTMFCNASPRSCRAL
jgi:hypothetical protein